MSFQQVSEIKKHILSIIEEYSTTNLLSSDDEDINKRIVPLINLHYQFFANQTQVTRFRDFELSGDDTNRNDYTPLSLGSNCQQLSEVKILENTNDVILDYYYLKNRLYVKNNFVGRLRVVYKAYVDSLTEIDATVGKDGLSDLDKTELEISPSAVLALCYMVAGDILKTDVSANHSAFDQKASQIINALDERKNGVVGVVADISYDGI